MSTILVVDDVSVNISILGELLRGKYKILVATSGRKAIDVALENQPDLILLDVIMSDMDGFETCRKLKENLKTREIPVIFFADIAESADIVKGFEVGCQDYIVKPFNKTEVLARVKNHIDLKKSREKTKLYALELERKNQELRLLLEKVEQIARIDFLTGIANRRYAIDRMTEELSRFNRSGDSFSILMIDVDDFKKINDMHGHECGDYILKHIVHSIQSVLRKHDLIARWGGEEFLIMLPGTDIDKAKIVAGKINNCVRSKNFHYMGTSFVVTITIGAVQLMTGDDLGSLIKRADEAMYNGKKSGKNCVIIAFPMTGTGPIQKEA